MRVVDSNVDHEELNNFINTPAKNQKATQKIGF